MRFGIVADPHIAPSDTAPYAWHNTMELPRSLELLDAALDWLRGQQVDALVLLGDVTEAADPASFAAVRDRLVGCGVPVLTVPGNCDLDPVTGAMTAYEQFAGEWRAIAPAVVSLAGGFAIELIGLAAEPDANGLRGVRATATGEPAAPIVLTHYSVLDLDPDLVRAGFRHSGNLTNRAEIEAGLRGSEAPVVVIHGHLHVHDARSDGNLLHLSCAALVEPPHHVSVIDVINGDDEITVERRAHSVQAFDVAHLPVFAPDRQQWRWSNGFWLSQ